MKIIPLILLFFLASVVCAQDVEGSSDPPLFERPPGFTIYDYTVTNFGAYRFCDENGGNIIVDGQITYYYYECDGEINPSKIIDKFRTAVTEAGGKMYGDDPNQKYMVYKTGDITTWVDLYAEDFYYTLNIIRKGEKLSKISSEDLKKSIEEKGFAILYFNFDRDKCIIKEECKPVLALIAETLKQFHGSGFEVSCYTDDIGRSDENLQVSENRAIAIVNQLIELGIDESILTAKGYGEEDPIADNKTVEGRSLNSRIVITRR